MTESEEARVREEEAAAAREAGEIGGESGMEDMDPAERASAEHGGGVAEGFEQAEQRLEEEATTDHAGGDPLRDAGETEEPGGAVPTHGEPDEVDSTETDEETQGTSGDLDGSAEENDQP